jgi:pimeloyl-ACP methyl ester carboxylesterase
MTREIKSVELPNQIVLPYVEQGDPLGLPLVLLHGFADSWPSFEHVLNRLPAAIHAFAVTQRGHGDASKPPAGYHLRDFAADLDAFLQAVHLRAAVIAGHSMGSAVALQFALTYPQHCLGLVLAGASASTRGNPGARQFWETTIAKLTDPIDPAFVRSLTEGMVVKPLPQPLLEQLIQESLKVPAHVWKGVFESRFQSDDDYSDQLNQIAVPTLIVWGELDPRYPRSDQEALRAAIPGARLVVYAGAGHSMHLEQPERFAADLAAFVNTIAG